MRPSSRPFTIVLSVSLALVVAACGGAPPSGGGPGSGEVARIDVSGPGLAGGTLVLDGADTAVLDATPRDGFGAPVATAPVRWRASGGVDLTAVATTAAGAAGPLASDVTAARVEVRATADGSIAVSSGDVETIISVDHRPVSQPAGCPAPTAGPTVHDTDPTASETWRADDGPHLVTQDLRLGAGVTVTVEPCAEVLLEEGVAIVLVETGARLVAEGEADRPIRFGRAGPGPWAFLRVEHPATASLAHAVLEGGGSDAITYDGATVVADGDSGDQRRRLLTVREVEIRDSQGYGMMVRRQGAFTTDSVGLTIAGSGASGGAHEAPLLVEPHALDGLPAGSYTGNAADEIVIDTLGEDVTLDTTIADRGVPYRVTRDLNVVRDSTAVDPTLRIEPGVVLRFEPGGVLEVGFSAFGGALVAEGTAEDPIVFTSASPTPAAGDWVGLIVRDASDPALQRVDHARIEYAGGDSGGQGFDCSDTPDDGAVIIWDVVPDSAFVTNTEVVASAAHGVIRGWTGPLVDFTPTNTFDLPVGFEPQTRPKNAPAGDCP